MTELFFESEKDFNLIRIRPDGNIVDLNFHDPRYAHKIAELNSYDIIACKPDNFKQIIFESLNTYDISIENIHISTRIIGEDINYIYEILFIESSKDVDLPCNEIASLLTIDGTNVKGNALLIKNYIDPDKLTSMYLVPITTSDITNILFDRVYNKAVAWDIDKGWEETRINGDIEKYADTFFDGFEYKKKELRFLKYNLIILYCEEEYEGKRLVLGELIRNVPIDKCIIYTSKFELFRDNISLDEIKKIIDISKVKESYKDPYENCENRDTHGRKIVWTKYKTLLHVYNSL